MKLLYTVILSAIVMGYASASTDPQSQLRTAVDNDRLEEAVALCKQDRDIYDHEIDYVIAKKQPDFVVKFIKGAGEVNVFTLHMLYKKGSFETIKKVLDESGFTDHDLTYLAEKTVVTCSPEKFLDLLGRIKPELREHAVRKGFYNIFNSHRSCVDPLLTALESSTFDNRLKDAAIQEVFKEGAYHRQDEWVVPFLDHPAITPPEVFCPRTTCILDFKPRAKHAFSNPTKKS